jgi:hypothetical protein
LVFKIVAEGPALLLQASRIGLVIQLFNLVQQVKFLRFLILPIFLLHPRRYCRKPPDINCHQPVISPPPTCWANLELQFNLLVVPTV